MNPTRDSRSPYGVIAIETNRSSTGLARPGAIFRTKRQGRDEEVVLVGVVGEDGIATGRKGVTVGVARRLRRRCCLASLHCPSR